ncbi:unnamed protein product [Diamesa tonsa]
MLEDKISFIKKMAYLHDLLYDSLTEVNSIYSLQIIPVLLSILVTQIFAVYTLSLIARSSNPSIEDYKLLIHLIIWSFYQALPVMSAIYYASKTTEYVSSS